MLVFPNINPVALELGPVAIHWYGIMYVLGFLAAWRLGLFYARRPYSVWTGQQVNDLIFYGMLGVILGGRIGYILFFDLSSFISNPVTMLQVWQGGMSFHGGLLGVIIAMLLFARRNNKSFFTVADFVAPLVPLGYFAGRIGNFINGELWGRVAPAELPWAMVFPHVDQLPRHPSMLYQALLEGLVLFALLWWFTLQRRPSMAVSGVFLIGMGGFRIFNEGFREPDAHIGYIAFDWFTMGQLLSVPMWVIGVILFWLAYRPAKSAVR
ncbi:MAG: prolipoprotein diacylglyceryl transferase [Gammaproteobacteria bacterium]|nr:prolipoprotein diacylglyceryl transferase [Gammaproteobacteria bacterium]